jgi:hypothetical protein
MPDITANSKKRRRFCGYDSETGQCFTAIREGVNKVIIGKGEELDQIIAGKAGTTISQ